MSQQDKARHSCETCRRKKTKCPAERPVCSICSRLNQQCVYLPRNRSSIGHVQSKISKTRGDRDRFDMLESQVTNLYEIIQQFSGDDHTISPHAQATRRRNLQASISPPKVSLATANFSRTTPTPSQQALDQCVKAYSTKIHAQPLQLFNIDHIAEDLLSSPQYLLWSFLALTLKLCTPDFYQGKEEEAEIFYSDAAHQTIELLVREGNVRTDLVQALCLLALSEVMSCLPAKAWMTIGMAGRVQTLRRMMCPNDKYEEDDADVKCHCAVFMLERMFCSQSPHSILPGDSIPLPASPSIPLSPLQASDFSQTAQPRSSPNSDAGESSSFATPDQNNQDFGINVSCVKSIAIWGDVVSHMQDIRNGKIDLLGPSDPAYQRFNSKICDCDAHFSNNHLLRNVLLNKRSLEDLAQHRDYWSVWTLTQIAIHGSQALLNHPFIHLIIPQDRSTALSSRIFQQQTVDQALFHSGWVARLIRAVEEAKLEINDPLIGNIVAATATVPWLFQFARDQRVARRAKRDVATCERLLSQMSNIWTQFIDKLETLRDLQQLAENAQPDTPRKNLTVSFKPSSVWKLLDSDISHTIRTESANTDQNAADAEAADSVIRVATKFVHPLEESRKDHTTKTTSTEPNTQPEAQFASHATPWTPGSHEPSMLDLFLQLDPDDFQWMQP